MTLVSSNYKPVGAPKKTARTATVPASGAMKVAQKENFALFILKGMGAKLAHLRGVLKLEHMAALENSILSSGEAIKATQELRKINKPRRRAKVK